jgi:hypothetical protein
MINSIIFVQILCYLENVLLMLQKHNFKTKIKYFSLQDTYCLKSSHYIRSLYIQRLVVIMIEEMRYLKYLIQTRVCHCYIL